MRTHLCDLLNVEVPIIQAPMGGASCPALAAAVSNAGALGMLALSWSSPEAVRQQIRETKAQTDRPFGANLVLEWSQHERLAICLEEGVPVVSFFWGDPAPLIQRVHDAGSVVLSTVASAHDARKAVEAGVDAVVAQGWEAGGHVRGHVATLPLIPTVVKAVAPKPVVAAGGIVDGKGVAAVLALGASGAWIGTRFLASQEAAVHSHYRELLLQAKETDTIYTGLFSFGWPNAPHRVLRNSTVERWEQSGCPADGERPGEGEIIGRSPTRGEIARYRSATPTTDTEGNIEEMSLWAGQGVGLVNRVQPAAEIVREIIDEASQTIERLMTLKH